MRPTISMPEISGLFGKSDTWFRKERDKLLAAGFPPPLPGAPTVWSRKLVMEWIDAGGVAPKTTGFAETVRERVEATIKGRAA